MAKGSVELVTGDVKAATASLERAVELAPGSVDALIDLGICYKSAGSFKDAEMCYKRALALEPNNPRAQNCLGNLLYKVAGSYDAENLYRRVISLQPRHADAHYNLGNVLKDTLRIEEAILHFTKAVELSPTNLSFLSNLCLVLSYGGDERKIRSVVQKYSALCESTSGIDVWHLRRHKSCERMGTRRLAIGYISADFYEHSVAFFIGDILRHHNSHDFSIYAYSNNPKKDHVTERLMGYIDHWCDCFAMSDDQLAQRIVDDEIDILVDLSGHTAGNRLPVFARKPAPVQVTWIGFPGTTGLKAMDYRITDEWFDPPGMTDQHHTETLVRIPVTNGVYTPPENAPDVAPLPSLTNGGFVFANLNNPAKMNDKVIGLWSRILVSRPGSKLMLGNASDLTLIERLTKEFAKHGVEAERLVFQPRLSIVEYLKLHHQIDLALDPFPYNGGTTSFHSLWMGVPVITLAGNTTPSRSGVAILARIGLHSFVSSSEEEYVALALKWSNDLHALAEIRRGLRERMNAPELQPAAVTARLEDAYKQMWARWLESRSSQSCKIQTGLA